MNTTMTSSLTKTLMALTSALAIGNAEAQTATPPAETSPHTLTGNLSLVSDYRFRGLSQSYRQPAIQGGFDYTHASGFYLGNWNSSVSGNSYNNGASLEADLYGGYRFEPLKSVVVDVGALAYLYPGARLNAAPGTPGDTKYDNAEVYVGLSSGGFSGKMSFALTDYFGLNGDTAGYAYWSSLPDEGSSKGTVYIDLNYNIDLGDKLTLGTHLGHLRVRHYGDLSYTDLKLSLTKEWAGVTLGAAVIGTNAKKDFYQVGNSAWQEPKQLGTATVVLSLAKTF